MPPLQGGSTTTSLWLADSLILLIFSQYLLHTRPDPPGPCPHGTQRPRETNINQVIIEIAKQATTEGKYKGAMGSSIRVLIYSRGRENFPQKVRLAEPWGICVLIHSVCEFGVRGNSHEDTILPAEGLLGCAPGRSPRRTCPREKLTHNMTANKSPRKLTGSSTVGKVLHSCLK